MWVTNFTEATGNGKGGYSSAPEQMIYRVEYSTFCFCGVSWEILPTQILSFCPISCLSSLPFLLLPLTPRRFGSQGLALPARVAIGRVWLKRLAYLRVFLSSEYLQSSLLQPFFALFMTSGRTLFICVYLLKEGNPMTNFHASSAINFFLKCKLVLHICWRLGTDKERSKECHIVRLLLGRERHLLWVSLENWGETEDVFRSRTGTLQAQSGRRNSKEGDISARTCGSYSAEDKVCWFSSFT